MTWVVRPVLSRPVEGGGGGEGVSSGGGRPPLSSITSCDLQASPRASLRVWRTVSRRDESSVTPCDLQASPRASLRVWRTVSRRDESSVTPCDLQASPRASLRVWRPVRSVWWPGVGRPYTWCLTLYCWLITSGTTTLPLTRLTSPPMNISGGHCHFCFLIRPFRRSGKAEPHHHCN